MEINTKEINPSWIIQTIIGILLAVIGVMANYQFQALHKASVKQSDEISLVKDELKALEIGLRGDRFTRTDWKAEEKVIKDDIKELEERVRALENNR